MGWLNSPFLGDLQQLPATLGVLLGDHLVATGRAYKPMGSHVALSRPVYWCLLALSNAVLGCFALWWAIVGDDG